MYSHFSLWHCSSCISYLVGNSTTSFSSSTKLFVKLLLYNYYIYIYSHPGVDRMWKLQNIFTKWEYVWEFHILSTSGWLYIYRFYRCSTPINKKNVLGVICTIALSDIWLNSAWCSKIFWTYFIQNIHIINLLFIYFNHTYVIEIHRTYGGFLSHRATSVPHPFTMDDFPW